MRFRLEATSVARWRAITLALVLSACVDDDEHLAADPLAQQMSDAQIGDAQVGDAGGPQLPSVSAASLPDCTAYLLQRRFVFGYRHPARITAAAATREGYVVVALDGVDIPLLKLARTPDGRSEANLHTLLPESQREVVALSEIRGDRLLVVHGPDADRVPVISALDLKTHVVVWSRPLRDPSGLPRPRYDRAGKLIGEQRGADLPGALVHRVFQRADGRYDVLANAEGSLYLFGFEPDGSAHYRTLIHPEPSTNVPSMVTLGDRSMAIAVDVDADHRMMFEAVHRHTLSWPARGNGLPVLLRISETGSPGRIEEPALPAGGRLTGNLTAPQDRATWFISDWNLPRQMLSSIGPWENQTRTALTPFRYRDDGLSSMAVVGENLYVAGLLDQKWGFKAQLQGGTAFLGRVARDGSLRWACADQGPVETWNVKLFSLTLHDTQAPLLSVQSSPITQWGLLNDNTLINQLRVYLMQEPSE